MSANSARNTDIQVRLGHAVHGRERTQDSALTEALDVASGSKPLAPRDPALEGPVTEAEEILGAAPRPIYAFLGLLHPALGTVGLIVSPTWTGRVQGVSRCDSGGLAGRLGGFACVDDPISALLELSFIGELLSGWVEAFLEEVSESYAGSESYVAGALPKYESWEDVRPRCIERARSEGYIDRRIWSWEVRLQDPPMSAEIECLVLSPEMRKRLESLRIAGASIPASLRVLSGSVAMDGIHWFNEAVVSRAFLGHLD